ncbi:outer membrane lipid asymmetry maintenance protein MlaD [Candidatus Schmidhempelia bombi]|jgi:phospholipid/cholesterol/gamma-HCH transport system substrate-binding protein|uniref:Outer membrane lipid asymmetry maintenance protein MlaD n=1 Tax=Candidatus Schmidhempelia bombi str. Bimp TaxID=1387197 RepID=A0AB94IAU5_9GAMM|nr:outer membrane lipid asymmetry maintenance protein MlaD [Candidatus Schmidhempelia bombi]TEA26526.1 outer membrane lipid asymmetry maintenance protein MlaD [Candidatus Schmidhempelia bombi str. Bimp]
MGNRKIEIIVGLFMLMVISSVLFLCLSVADISSIKSGSTYRVYAVFDNIGGLKARSPIKIGGVVVGRIKDIVLTSSTNENYKPYVIMDIDQRYNQIPSSSALTIKTSGLLGEQFIAIDLGVKKDVVDEIDEIDALEAGYTVDQLNNSDKIPEYFQEGFVIHNTKPAMALEDLIGQFLYSSDNKTSEQPDSQTKE